jgi:hypothetical protein
MGGGKKKNGDGRDGDGNSPFLISLPPIFLPTPAFFLHTPGSLPLAQNLD